MHSTIMDLIASYSSLLILWVAILLNLVIPLPYSAHPARIWHQFAQVLASKVNRHRTHQQDFISGTLATVLMLLPAVAVFVSIENLTWQDEYFQLILLFLALDWNHLLTLSKNIGQQLSREDKQEARKTLEPLLNRNVETLSLVGLGKATTETLISGYARHVIGVLFWYGLAGGLGAFMFRLLSELQRAWSPAQVGMRPFGTTVTVLMHYAEWIPIKIFTLITLMSRNASSAVSDSRNQSRSWPSPSLGLLIAIIGNKLQLSLGGPAIYGEQKSVRAKLGGRIAPSAIHIAQITSLLNQSTFIWLIVQSLISIFFISVLHV